jgi:uncharacterized protein
MTIRNPFHLAFPVTDLPATREFFTTVLRCPVGRESDRWIDFDFFGHQITAHLVGTRIENAGSNDVDTKDVPVPHFGAILEWDQFQEMADHLKQSGVAFIIEPYVRFAGEVGEQATMFFRDPNGNNIELKAFKDFASIFAR